MRQLDVSLLGGKYAGKPVSRKDLTEDHDHSEASHGDNSDEEEEEDGVAESSTTAYTNDEDTNERLAEKKMNSLFYDLEHFSDASDEEGEEEEEEEEGENEEQEEEEEEDDEEGEEEKPRKGKNMVRCTSLQSYTLTSVQSVKVVQHANLCCLFF